MSGKIIILIYIRDRAVKKITSKDPVSWSLQSTAIGRQ